VLERTRSDLTITILQSRLQGALEGRYEQTARLKETESTP
jgi:hypothetical protein